MTAMRWAKEEEEQEEEEDKEEEEKKKNSLQRQVPSASSYNMMRQRIAPQLHLAHGTGFLLLSFLSNAGVIMTTTPHDGHTN